MSEPASADASKDAETVAAVTRLGRLVPRTRQSQDVVLVVIAAILFAISWPTVFVTLDVPTSLAPALAALSVLPVALIRASPFTAWALTMTAAVAIGLFFDPLPDFDFPWQPTHFLVMLATVVAVTVTSPWKQVLLGWFVPTASALLFMPPDLKAGWAFGITMVTAAAVLLRGLLLSRRQLARQARLSEAERAQRALLEERSRIARDLHDVVAHRMSMVVVQAQTASRRLDGVPPHVEREFNAIGDQAREALNEVRGMLGVLRSDGQLPEDAPQPGLRDIERLLASSRGAGVDLRWSVIGDPEGSSDASGMVVYRILQECLANASRHAPGAGVRTEIEYGAAAVTLSVVSGPAATDAPPRPPAGQGSGAGIHGMITRARAIGGDVEAGPTGDGGFAVRAVIPKRARADAVDPSSGGSTVSTPPSTH